MVDWVMKIPSLVFNQIESEFSQKLKNQYKMTRNNFSSISSTPKDPVFPFVYVHALPAVEQGQDLEGTTINAALFTFQIDVYDNENQARAREVMTEVIKIMKSMRFSVIAMPEFESTDDKHRCTARFRRLIGARDVMR